jgi:hypothetical protein
LFTLTRSAIPSPSRSWRAIATGELPDTNDARPKTYVRGRGADGDAALDAPEARATETHSSGNERRATDTRTIEEFMVMFRVYFDAAKSAGGS